MTLQASAAVESGDAAEAQRKRPAEGTPEEASVASEQQANGQVHKKIKVAADSETVPSIMTTADEQTAAGASADVHMASPKRSQSRSRSPEKRTSLLSADATATEAAKERSRSRSRSKSPARAPVTPAASEEMTMSIDTPGETKATVPLPDVTTTAARRSPSPTRMDSVVEAAAAVPASAATVAPLAAPTTAFTATPESMRFAYELVRGLKKRKDAGPFLLPVDPVALGIPQYFDVVKQPMDLSTVEKNLRNGSYKVLDELIADVQLIFHNCYIFNPPDHIVYKMGQGLEQSFHNQLKKLPAALSASSGTPLKLSTASASGSTTSMAGGESPMSSRPKRDVHAPPPKDLPSEEATVKRKKSGSRRRLDEMRWCQTVHRELMKKQYESHMFPFYVPVDHVALNIPTYPDVIKHPMDLATIKKKLDGDEYSSCEDFEADVRLMFNNCYTFNPVGSDVFNLAQTSEDVFSRKWAEKPSFSNHRDSVSSAVGGAHAADSGLGASSGSLAARHSISKKKAAEAVVSESSEDSSDEDELSATKTMQIQMIEQQILFLQQQLDALRQTHKKSKKKKKRSSKGGSGGASNAARRASKATGGESGTSKPPAPPRKKRPTSTEPAAPKPVKEITFEEKRELSEMINRLDGEQLNVVVQIIRESLKDLPNGEQEIELDMDTLDPSTLNKLWAYVKKCVPRKRPSKPRPPKPEGADAGTSADPAENASRIQELERELARMDGRVDKHKKMPKAGGDGGSSDSSDGSDGGAASGSGSDSE